MGIFYLLPAGALWVLYAVCQIITGGNMWWWIDYPLFGMACAASAVGGAMAYISRGVPW